MISIKWHEGLTNFEEHFSTTKNITACFNIVDANTSVQMFAIMFLKKILIFISFWKKSMWRNKLNKTKV